VEKPHEMDYNSIREALLRIVVLCLDSDPALIPSASLSSNGNGTISEEAGEGEDTAKQPDDFRFWSEKQATRIALCIKHAFGVEYAPEVVVADANVGSLARKILVSKELLAASH
jgi:phosphatidylethanolamine N-methyltransferase